MWGTIIEVSKLEEMPEILDKRRRAYFYKRTTGNSIEIVPDEDSAARLSSALAQEIVERLQKDSKFLSEFISIRTWEVPAQEKDIFFKLDQVGEGTSLPPKAARNR